MRRWVTLALVSALSACLVAGCGKGPKVAPTTRTPSAATTTVPASAPVQANLTSLVDPFVGTGAGSAVEGEVGTFPGADMPFGMIQWSPDTSPDRAQGGGYFHRDSKISGFSLTHLSGAGCPVFGDVPILPTTGAVPQHPGNATEPFSHAGESASPDFYEVGLGSPAITVQLSTTLRTGIGEISFPSVGRANLLFKVSGSANGIESSSVNIVGQNEVTGSATSGLFCGTVGTYTLHFVAEFNRPFQSHGVWSQGHLDSGSSACAGNSQAACGAWVSFDAAHDHVVMVKVGLSYVSAANAASNLKAEDPGWNLDKVEQAGTQAWNVLLNRIQVEGGSRTEEETFYTALYHSLLDPSVFSDDNGQYEGFDGRVHNDDGHTQYANFSEWDIYRSEIPLLSIVAPSQVSDMVQSLVNDAAQGGWLPKWELADIDTGNMDGDSADPIIASAYAFGVRGFDASAALKDMLKGATESGTGRTGVQERNNLSEYEQLGYVQQNAVYQAMGVTVGASETLEYAIDDFAIAQMALGQGDQSDYRTMMARAQNWQNLFNPATGYEQARLANGSFNAGSAFPTPPPALVIQNVGQGGFQEGNAIQYTWSVPQDLSTLFALMGGDATVTSDLNTFFTQLNAGPDLPYDWAGNEPSLWTPWEYDYAGAPWRTEQVVRSIADSLYSLSPAGEPGNDDLGAMASWYVWAALGLYPLTPGTANLVLASPMFPRSTIYLPSGKALTLTGQGAPQVYVQSAQVATGSGEPEPLNQPWLPASILQTGGTVDFTLGSAPATSWGAGPTSAPPSYTAFAAPAVGYTLPSGAVQTQAGSPTAVTLGIQSAGNEATTVAWRASAQGVTVSPSSGQLSLPAASSIGDTPRVSTTMNITASTAGTRYVTIDFSVPGHPTGIPSVTLEVNTGS